MSGMGRWASGGRERLESAALDLFVDPGYDETTVAQIADRAGLTRSTFFRHFADKREVVFGTEDTLSDLLVAAVVELPAGLSVAAYLTAAFDRAGELAFTAERHRQATQRRTIVARHPELRERELLKRAGISAAMTSAFVRQGVDVLGARLGGEFGVLALDAAFERWTDGEPTASFGVIAADVVERLAERAGTLR
jgi:AcrR family transcriptional regulator